MVKCTLLHHGAAASSSSHTLEWIENRHGDNILSSSSSIVYSSHAILNICSRTRAILQNGVEEPLWRVTRTLRTSTLGNHSTSGSSSKRVITAVKEIYRVASNNKSTKSSTTTIATGFSDGTVNLWIRNGDNDWEEQVLVDPSSSDDQQLPSITDLHGIVAKDGTVVLVSCTWKGAHLISTNNKVKDNAAVTVTCLSSHPASTVKFQQLSTNSDDNIILILIGSAAPRHNKIDVYCLDTAAAGANIIEHLPQHAGFLMGHEDWLADFAFTNINNKTDCYYLASASRDCKIRLWEFRTTAEINGERQQQALEEFESEEIVDDDDDGNQFLDEEEEAEGEARLEIHHPNSRSITRVTLEALLLGHEEPVTSVVWHPSPQLLYKQDRVLLSSSMDRAILIWSATPATSSNNSIWTPLTRVGSAGGILGGSVGSTLLGFVKVAVEPTYGSCIVGQAYGGAIHVWSLDRQETENDGEKEGTAEDLALRNKWNATPCITGHFDGVTDLSWEASTGEYLLTVSKDQTCRLWAPVRTIEDDEVWIELARPQVHGYDLTTVSSISTPVHRHFMVSGADEKEIRGFDAPLRTTRLLSAVAASRGVTADNCVEDIKRVDRAYIPALGLSNKASAADGADVDIGDGGDDADSVIRAQLKLPLERDLGAVSLWPETRKLYGHNTEIFCLTSTITAQTGPQYESNPFTKDVLVASSAKAREVTDAFIRIWNVEQAKCVSVLQGGHKSTVACLAFSPDGRYIVSSGKDRRLCLWKRKADNDFVLAFAKDSAHKRIVWSIHFCPHDPTLLASGSRDGPVKIWKIEEDDGTTSANVIFSFEASARTGPKAEAVTALSFAPRPWAEEDAMLAVGLESGMVELWRIPKEVSGSCALLGSISRQLSHIAAVTKLAWRPLVASASQGKVEGIMILASCSSDHGCRLFRIDHD